MNKSLFVCQSCGNEFPKWAGKCSGCGEWNTLVETPVSTKKNKSQITNHKQKGLGEKSQIINLASPSLVTNSGLPVTSGIGEFDRVLGSGGTPPGPSPEALAKVGALAKGGFVPGQVILLAGEPGIGKSTLLLQVADALAKENSKSQITNLKQKSEISNNKSQPKNARNLDFEKLNVVCDLGIDACNLNPQVLYVCGEESPTQIKLRASRLGISGQNISLLAETNVDSLISHLSNLSSLSNLLIVDSIQTLTTSDLASAQGSVAQVKECTARILNFAKERGIPTILIGHVNKDGDIAGPKVLEHMVDTVMYLEGERFGQLRLLRSIKNRFGDVGEVGVFQMGEIGFVEVKNPSALFIEERATTPGSVITVTMEGTRPVLLEVQALVSKSSFNYPRRSSSGFDLNRLYFICAVLEKHLKIPLQGFDVYVNVTGGAKISEPSADLAVALAIVSSFKNKAVSLKTVAFGELGLSGEVRMVGSQKKREGEAKKLGFINLVSPTTAKTLQEAVGLAL